MIKFFNMTNAEVEEHFCKVLQEVLSRSDHGLLIKVGDQQVHIEHHCDEDSGIYIPQDIQVANAGKWWLGNYIWN